MYRGQFHKILEVVSGLGMHQYKCLSLGVQASWSKKYVAVSEKPGPLEVFQMKPKQSVPLSKLYMPLT